MTILIPAYKPDDKLITLLCDLAGYGFERVIVVDDGSGPAFAHIFDRARDKGAVVLSHVENMGKGRGLKTGFAYVIEHTDESEGVVIADADGQHLPEDVAAVARKLKANPDGIVLGTRGFSGKVPIKSRLGNGITRCVFALATGVMIKDTQTGLRGFPVKMLRRLLLIKGERYEYETNMLLCAAKEKTRFIRQTIQTVYIDNNSGSHFNALRDPLRIYGLILRFCLPSLLMFVADLSLFAAGMWALGQRLPAPAALAISLFGAKAAALAGKSIFCAGPDSALVVAVKTALAYPAALGLLALGLLAVPAKLIAAVAVGVLWLAFLTMVSKRRK